MKLRLSQKICGTLWNFVIMEFSNACFIWHFVFDILVIFYCQIAHSCVVNYGLILTSYVSICKKTQNSRSQDLDDVLLVGVLTFYILVIAHILHSSTWWWSQRQMLAKWFFFCVFFACKQHSICYIIVALS